MENQQIMCRRKHFFKRRKEKIMKSSFITRKKEQNEIWKKKT